MTQTAQGLLADIRELAPHVTSRAAEIETGRRIPPDLVEALRSIGVFRMFVPQSHGGLELDLPSALEVIGALGRLDGSLGWTAMIGAGSAIFRALPPAGNLRSGLPERPGHGLLPLGAACRYGRGSAWRLADQRTVAVHERLPACRLDSRVLHRVRRWEAITWTGQGGRGRQCSGDSCCPALDWQIEDTWYVAGLKGTGSHHVTLRDTLVPAANSFDPVNGGTNVSRGRSIKPCCSLFRCCTAPSPLYSRRRARRTRRARPTLGDSSSGAAVPMRNSEIFQYELGRIEAELQAARAFCQVQAGSHWHHGTLPER